MTKEEIKKAAEEMIEAQCDESGCAREEVLEVSTLCFLEKYINEIIVTDDGVGMDEEKLAALPARLLEKGIRIGGYEGGPMRFLTNNDVGPGEIDRLVEAIRESF